MQKKLTYYLILSRHTDDQRLQQPGWMKGTTVEPQLKVIVLDATFIDHYIYTKNRRDRLVPSRDIDDQRMLQSDWLRAFQGLNEEPDVSKTCSFNRIIKNTTMGHF